MVASAHRRPTAPRQTPPITAPTDLQVYDIEDVFIGRTFLEGFDFFTGSDPTHGRVNYVNQTTAHSENLIHFTDRSFIMRADSHTILEPGGPGRDAVRISSRKAYGHGLIISDIWHMPVGCGTWPALWSNANAFAWPSGGEIDIIEGANDRGTVSTLHTGWECWMNGTSMDQTGSLWNRECTSGPGHNAGCSVRPHKLGSDFQTRQGNRTAFFGPGFNRNGGGWHAVERTANSIRMWFWARDDPHVPFEVRWSSTQGVRRKGQISTRNWGIPYANFGEGAGCDLSKFQPQNIIINLTFCGDWAGNAYPADCPKTCIRHVEEDPASFAESYWDISSLAVWSPAEGEVASLSRTTGDHVDGEDHQELHTAAGQRNSLKENFLGLP
ncbi:hypothetical protein FRB98_008350 [Tulasnella sp. 332]|nr:hypothetical protein FRB98_008350 [Tulasnella sp. 332]